MIEEGANQKQHWWPWKVSGRRAAVRHGAHAAQRLRSEEACKRHIKDVLPTAGNHRENIFMARKRDPDDEVDHFVTAVGASLDVWERTQTALAASDLELRKVASLDAFVRSAVEWEGFRSRWHIAAINRDSSAYRVDVESRLRASIKGGRFGELEAFVHLALPAQLSLTTVQRLLDPSGRNISFGDKWTDRARAELPAQYATKVLSLSLADLLLVTACEKIRNAIVHRSPGSVDEMNTALVVLDPTVDADLVRTNKVTGAGIAAYLHARPLSDRRIEVWHHRLRDVAGRLRT